MIRNLVLITMIVMTPGFTSVVSAQDGAVQENNFNLERISIEDWRTEMEAATIEIPAGWSHEVTFSWYEDPIPIYTVSFVTYDESENHGWATLPLTGYVWYEDPGAQQFYPKGSIYSPNVTSWPPMGPDEYLREMLVPYLEEEYSKKYEVQDLSIVDIQVRPDVAENFRKVADPEGYMADYTFRAASAHVTFRKDEIDIEERVTVVIGGTVAYVQTFGVLANEQVTYWSLSGGTIERAVLGELADYEDMYRAMQLSISWNPGFLAAYDEIRNEGYLENQAQREQQQEDWEEVFNGE